MLWNGEIGRVGDGNPLGLKTWKRFRDKYLGQHQLHQVELVTRLPSPKDYRIVWPDFFDFFISLFSMYEESVQ